MRVLPVSCLRDNYAYLLEGKTAGEFVVIDPSIALPVKEALRANGGHLVGVWATHHHTDHIGGIDELWRQYPELPVVAFAGDTHRIPNVTQPVRHQDVLTVAGYNVQILHIPGHTRGAIAFVVHDANGPRAVFCGDTLFGAGCGRLLEGTAAEMYRSLTEVLGSLSDDMLVYCGHEYTAANLRFAAQVEPNNENVRHRARRVAEEREQCRPTVPLLLGEERATNPFLRCNHSAVRAFVGASSGESDVEVFGRLRRAKDNFS